MVIRNSRMSASSLSLKIGTVFVFVGFILHVVGFSMTRWATLTGTHSIVKVEASYYVGLWKHCACIEFGVQQCTCFSRGADKGVYMFVLLLIYQTFWKFLKQSYFIFYHRKFTFLSRIINIVIKLTSQ